MGNKDVALPGVTRVETCYLHLECFGFFHEKDLNSSPMAVPCHYWFMVISGCSNTMF